MRSFILRSCAYLVLSSCVVGVHSGASYQLHTVNDVLTKRDGDFVDDGGDAGSTSSEALSGEPTIFNGIEVPPMKELSGDGFDTETKDGYWCVTASDYFFLAPFCVFTERCELYLILGLQVCQALFPLLPPLHSNSTDMANAL